MKKRETGTYQALGEQKFFIPHSLLPSPPLEITNEMSSLLDEASLYLGKLNGMSQELPDLKRFIKAYVIKEALLSSEIEGIHTTLIDVFTSSSIANLKVDENTQLVLNYTKALEEALNMLQENLPISSRLILKAHEILMGSGSKANLGNYRRQSVRVGNLIPPPATNIKSLMSELEHYINEPSSLSAIIKAGLVHVQFETIHPFLNGNGRIGRLLIVLMFIDSKHLEAPILYPSYYFKKYHAEYYKSLDLVRTHGDFESWIVYYLKAIRDSALDAYLRAQDIKSLEQQLRLQIQNDKLFARIRENANAILNFLFANPVTGISEISQETGKAYNTIHNIIKRFEELEIISEEKTNTRSKIYHFKSYLKLLEKEYSK